MRGIRELAQEHILGMTAYAPGKQPQGEGWIKLNTNEAPYQPSPEVIPAIEEEIRRLPLYPNPTSQPLRQAIAKHHGLSPANVIIGNGSDDILNLLARVFGGPGHSVGQSFPSYSLYPVLTLLSGGNLLSIPFAKDFSLPVRALAETRADLLFLTCPNAPVGVRFPADQLQQLAEQFDGLLVIDEAYADFARDNAVSLMGQFPRLVITRTFSKAYALAGLRVGYALANPEVIELLDRVRDSYNVNRLSQAGALAALRDTEYYRKAVSGVVDSREQLRSELQSLDWQIYPSEANFLFAAPVDRHANPSPELAQALFQHLESRRILVRYFPKHPLTASHLRISIGSPSQMDRLIEEIRTWQKTA